MDEYLDGFGIDRPDLFSKAAPFGFASSASNRAAHLGGPPGSATHVPSSLPGAAKKPLSRGKRIALGSAAGFGAGIGGAAAEDAYKTRRSKNR